MHFFRFGEEVGVLRKPTQAHGKHVNSKQKGTSRPGVSNPEASRCEALVVNH